MAHSHTDDVIQDMRLFGARSPIGLDEEDTRPVPQQFDIECALSDIMDIISDLAEDTIMDDFAEGIIDGWITALHFKLKSIQRDLEKANDQVRMLITSFDGSEVSDQQLMGQKNLAKSLETKEEVLETMRDCLVMLLSHRFGTAWRPPHGNHVSKNRQLTHAVVDARAYLAARDKKEQSSVLLEGTKIGFAGGKHYENVDKIWAALDKVKGRYPDMILVHGGAPKGAEHIAKLWAKNRDVRQIECIPDWRTDGRAAPFLRNDQILKLGLQGLVAAPGEGITDNLIEKAEAKNVKVMYIKDDESEQKEETPS